MFLESNNDLAMNKSLSDAYCPIRRKKVERCIAVSFHCPAVQPGKGQEASVAEAAAAAGLSSCLRGFKNRWTDITTFFNLTRQSSLSPVQVTDLRFLRHTWPPTSSLALAPALRRHAGSCGPHGTEQSVHGGG